MKYTIKRGEQTFGPYTLADLQKYVQTGNVQATDLAQSEGMSDWAPVSQVLGNIPMPATAYGAAAAPALAPVTTVPLPPNLHWGLLLAIYVVAQILNALLHLLLNSAWSIVQANWARKLDGNNNTLVLVIMYPAAIFSAAMAAAFGFAQQTSTPFKFTVVLILGGVVCYIVGMFKIKAAMESYYPDLRLSGVMTFFFSTIYFQYHINQLAKINEPMSSHPLSIR